MDPYAHRSSQPPSPPRKRAAAGHREEETNQTHRGARTDLPKASRLGGARMCWKWILFCAGEPLLALPIARVMM